VEALKADLLAAIADVNSPLYGLVKSVNAYGDPRDTRPPYLDVSPGVEIWDLQAVTATLNIRVYCDSTNRREAVKRAHQIKAALFRYLRYARGGVERLGVQLRTTGFATESVIEITERSGSGVLVGTLTVTARYKEKA